MRIRLLLLAAALVSAAGQPGALTPAQRRANLESFDTVWTTVRDKHWDPRPGGLDWGAVRAELRPRMERAAGMEEAREVLTAMLTRLHQSHFGIVPARSYEELNRSGAGEGTPGIDVRVVDGRALVTAVAPDSPAGKRGVAPGWEIVRVAGQEIAPALESLRAGFAASTTLGLLQVRAVTSRLSGPAGIPFRVEFRDGEDEPRDLELDRAVPGGTLAKLGYLPPMRFRVEWRKLPAGIGYLRFNLFFEPEALIGAIRESVAACGGCRGYIIDLRGNPGGIGGLATGVAGWFIDRPGLELGSMQTRDTTVKFAVFPRPGAFRGPLAILVDGCSASTAEIFAAGLKDLGRARIFGSRTAGAALPSVFEKLPNGDGFQYAIANYTSVNGKALEGTGLEPDEAVALDRKTLLEGRDGALEAAVSWIETQKN